MSGSTSTGPLIKSERNKLGFKIINIEVRDAGNSMAIAKFRDQEIYYFGPGFIDHDLIRGCLILIIE